MIYIRYQSIEEPFLIAIRIAIRLNSKAISIDFSEIPCRNMSNSFMKDVSPLAHRRHPYRRRARLRRPCHPGCGSRSPWPREPRISARCPPKSTTFALFSLRKSLRTTRFKMFSSRFECILDVSQPRPSRRAARAPVSPRTPSDRLQEEHLVAKQRPHSEEVFFSNTFWQRMSMKVDMNMNMN